LIEDQSIKLGWHRGNRIATFRPLRVYVMGEKFFILKERGAS